MRIAFWNTHKNEGINRIVCDIITENRIDIAVLAEYKANSKKLIRELSGQGIQMEQYVTFGCERIVMFGSRKGLMPASQNKYYSMQLLDGKYILCGMHLPSQTYANHQGRRNIVIDMLLQDISQLEKEAGVEQTVLFGDFNENPYETGCLAADKFHGIPSRNDALRGSRTVMGRKFKMFYNPMWNLFGDFQYPPGTYYYNGGSPSHPFWNMYDQVMIRPALQGKFVSGSLKILVGTKQVSFVNQHKRPRKEISDHLPIVFEIKEGPL